jgi:mannosyltransferase
MTTLRNSSPALLILLLAFALRFHMLGAQSLWNDEGSAYVQSTRTFFQIADHAARDIHPPGYYWLLGGWRLMTGESEFALRALSAVAGVLMVALTYALGRRLYHPTAGGCAALFVALNTFNLYYSQEARMYALLGLWSIAAMWAFAGFVQTGGWRWALAFALFNAAGLYTHYAYPAVMVAQGVLFLLWGMTAFVPALKSATLNPQPSALLAYLLANVLTIGLYLPWLPMALRQVTTWPNTGQAIPVEQALQVVFGWFALGITYEVGGTSSAILFFLLFGLIVLRRDWWAMLVPVVWVAATVGGFLALGLFREANLKFLIPAQIGFALWLGRGVWVLWTLQPRRTAPIFRAAPKLAAVVGTFSLAAALWTGLQPLYHAPEFQRDDYRGIVATIKAGAQPNDAIILNAPGQLEVFRYYYGEGGNVYPLPIGMTVDADATLAATRDIIQRHDRVYAVLWGTAERDPQNIVENTLDAEAYEIDNVWYRNVRLARYGASEDMGEAVESGARFGEAITLQRLRLSAGESAGEDVLTTLKPGDVLQVRLEWMTDTPPMMDYVIFVQLLSPEGALVAQRDSPPGGGTRPTTTWQPGETIFDHHALVIPDNLTVSHYTLILGFYNPASPSERLAVNSGQDYFTVGMIAVGD